MALLAACAGEERLDEQLPRAADPAAPEPPAIELGLRAGGALVRSASEDALYLADEDHGVVRRFALPLDHRREPAVLAIDGAPAQVLPLADRVLVTRRDPGALVTLRYRDGALHQEAEVPLPGDAWGIAVTPDARLALVSSAWTHQLSAVALEDERVLWTIDVAREPRGIAITPDGATAYVSHLVGAELTRVDLASAEASRLALSAAPLRAPWGQADRMQASLGYALALSPDGARLFAARHALGAVSSTGWQGAASVDVLLTADDTPLAPRRTSPRITSEPGEGPFGELTDPAGIFVGADHMPFAQPRAVIYRERTRTLLVASEGDDRLVELDARALVPDLAVVRSYTLGQRYEETLAGPREGTLRIPAVGGAPTGIALSEDEETAYVFCRSTYDIAIVALGETDEAMPWVDVAGDPLGEEASVGRRLFYSARDHLMSERMACAGCHPEGRDDGFVWHEEIAPFGENERIFVSNPFLFSDPTVSDGKAKEGMARQTPMLAGRVDRRGPYGWHAESATLVDRIAAGFGMHRWFAGFSGVDEETLRIRARHLAAFLRKGLVPPPRHQRPLTALEERGRALFSSPSTQCSECHAPERGFGHDEPFFLNRLPPRPGFRADPETRFKVPSLRFVGGTAPYLHDGSAASLEELLLENHDRMGKTSQLSPDDRRALIAYLETL